MGFFKSSCRSLPQLAADCFCLFSMPVWVLRRKKMIAFTAPLLLYCEYWARPFITAS